MCTHDASEDLAAYVDVPYTLRRILILYFSWICKPQTIKVFLVFVAIDIKRIRVCPICFVVL